MEQVNRNQYNKIYLYNKNSVILELRDYNNIFDTSIINNRVVNKTGVLFPRLDTAKEIEYIQSIMKTK